MPYRFFAYVYMLQNSLHLLRDDDDLPGLERRFGSNVLRLNSEWFVHCALVMTTAARRLCIQPRPAMQGELQEAFASNPARAVETFLRNAFRDVTTAARRLCIRAHKLISIQPGVRSSMGSARRVEVLGLPR